MEKEKSRNYDYIRLGKRIQARRKEIGLTQEELAEKIDCSLTHLSRLESGSPPGLDTLIRLSYLLGYSLDEMVGLYPSPSPYVHEICDLFLVHSEDEQKYALWLLQYFFYILDQKEADFLLRKRKTRSGVSTVKNNSSPPIPPKEFIKHFNDVLSASSQEETKRKLKKNGAGPKRSSKTTYTATECTSPRTAEDPTFYDSDVHNIPDSPV